MYESYHVQNGEDLAMLASKFQTTVDELVKLNNLKYIYNLKEGEVLKVPIQPSLAFTIYEVKKGDNLYSIAKERKTTVAVLVELNGLDKDEYLYPGQLMLVPQNGVGVYITKMGDDIKTIIDNSGISLDNLFLYNKRIYLLPDQLITYSNKVTKKDA